MIVFLKIALISKKFKVKTPDWTQIKYNLKNVYIWDQSGTGCQAVWELKAEYWKTMLMKIWVFELQLQTLVLL